MKEIEIKGMNEKIYEHTTPEGLKIYIWQNEKVKGSYFSLSVNYGSIHTKFKVDNKSYKVPNGVAHFLEHVKFNMDKNTTAHDIFKKIGGDANAFTTFKFTSYIVYTADKVEENLNTLLDFVYTPYFTKSLINKEKGIIVEEAKMGQDDPYSISYFTFLKQLFHKLNYRYEITGTPEEINTITLEDIENVYNTFYHPENMFLVATGNVNPYEIVRITEENLKDKTFKKYANPKLPTIKEDKSVVKHHQELELKITSPEFRYALKIPRRKFKNITDRELIIYLYILLQANFGPTSDFREMLREKELVSSFNSSINYVDDYIVLNFYATTDYYQEIEKALDDQIKKQNISKEDFERKRKVEIANLILKYDDLVAMNEFIQNDLILFGKIIDDVKDIYENISLTKMKEVMEAVSLENKATMLIKPIKEKKENEKEIDS